MIDTPFQYFGGKARVASLIWARLGDVDSFVEPFCGSAAVLLARPTDAPDGNVGGGGRRETVNDADGMIANFWRAAKADPDAVAHHADWPCNEADLHARHIWLVNRKAALTERLCADPEFFDAKIAGWWVWGQGWWIAGGWCEGKGPWNTDGERLVKMGGGVRRQRPHLSDDGQGVNRKLPHLSDDGRGVKRQLPHLGNDGDTCADYSAFIRDYMRRLASRLRRVRVCCGDWTRVVTPSAAGYKPSDANTTVGLLLDPPYSTEANRDMGCYATDCGNVAHEVREWCAEAGKDKRLRIALCGYSGEHEPLESLGWSVHEWATSGSMGRTARGESNGKANAKRERIWFSPACIPEDEGTLFGGRTVII